MRRVLLTSAAAFVTATASALAFDFKADEFERVFRSTALHYGRDHLGMHYVSCDQETSGRGGICYYAVSPSVSLAARNALGTDVPSIITLAWNGDRYGVGTMASAARTVTYALSPEMPDDLRTEIYGAVRNAPVDAPGRVDAREWRFGNVIYSFRAAPMLGRRDNVLFQAVDGVAEAARLKSYTEPR